MKPGMNGKPAAAFAGGSSINSSSIMKSRGIVLIMAALGCGSLGITMAQDAVKPAESAQKSTQPLDSDSTLAGWWRFEETSGGTAADASGKGRNGVLEGDATFDTASVPGRIGKAIRFSGGKDCIRIKDFKGVTGQKPRTLAAWVKTASREGVVASWGADGPGKLWQLGYVRGGMGVNPKGGYLYMKSVTADDNWHHVAVVVREASPPNLHDDVKLFIDGEPAEIDDIGLLDLWPIDTGDKMDVAVGQRFKGAVDELRLYERALSEDEIKALFKLGEK